MRVVQGYAEQGNAGAARSAFTLVEMLVVITIIGVLAGLISVAVSAAARRARVMAISREVEQLQAALSTWKEKYSEFPPDFGGTEAGNSNATWRSLARRLVTAHFQTAFPRYWFHSAPDTAWDKRTMYALAWHMDNAGIDINLLDPSTALAFWLGGPPQQDANGRFMAQPSGMSPNPQNPLEKASVSGSRLPPMFGFDLARIKAVFAGNANVKLPTTTRMAFRYYPDLPGTATQIPYIYFAARYAFSLTPTLNVGGTQTRVAVRGYNPDIQIWPPKALAGVAEETEGRSVQVRVRPYFRMTLDGKVADWFNPASCQIICGGLDGQYGAIMSDGGQGDPQNFPVPRVPSKDNMLGQGHYDNVTNFGVIQSIPQ